VTLTFGLLTLKVVSEPCVTWATTVPILVFLGLSVLDLGQMYVTDVKRQTDRRQTASSLYAPAYYGRVHYNNNNKNNCYNVVVSQDTEALTIRYARTKKR